MLKRRKWNDWVILEDTNTGQKSFALPTPKTAPFTNWSWSETNGEKQNSALLAAMIESIERFVVQLDHSQIETAWDFASRDKCALYTNCIPIPHAQT